MGQTDIEPAQFPRAPDHALHAALLESRQRWRDFVAMATDLAEFLGGAIGLSLLFDMPLFAGLVVTGLVTMGVLMLHSRGYRPLELVIGGLVTAIGACYLVEMVLAPIDWPALAWGAVRPTLPGGSALLLAVGIIGATVMPHAIYLHSGLLTHRIPLGTDKARRRALHYSNREVVLAMLRSAPASGPRNHCAMGVTNPCLGRNRMSSGR